MRVSIIVATSADGFIAKNPEAPSTTWTSKADKKRFVSLTKKIGTVVMGHNTFKTINTPLANRRNIVFSDQDLGNGVETTTESPKELIARLEKEGVQEIAVCGGQKIYTDFIKSGLVDKICLTKEPLIFGKGLDLFSEEINIKLEVLKIEQEDNSVFIEYKIIK